MACRTDYMMDYTTVNSWDCMKDYEMEHTKDPMKEYKKAKEMD